MFVAPDIASADPGRIRSWMNAHPADHVAQFRAVAVLGPVEAQEILLREGRFSRDGLLESISQTLTRGQTSLAQIAADRLRESHGAPGSGLGAGLQSVLRDYARNHMTADADRVLGTLGTSRQELGVLPKVSFWKRAKNLLKNSAGNYETLGPIPAAEPNAGTPSLPTAANLASLEAAQTRPETGKTTQQAPALPIAETRTYLGHMVNAQNQTPTVPNVPPRGLPMG